MKKILLTFAVVLGMAMTAQAQHELGGIVGGMNGLSYKYWFNDALALQADLGVGLTCTRGSLHTQNYTSEVYQASGWDFILNPNVLYHFELPANLKLYVGGGLNIGMLSLMSVWVNNVAYTASGTGYDKILGKFGINAALGLSYDFDAAPLVLAFDFRPGYGLGFHGEEKGAYYTMPGYQVNYFDWKLGVALRYKF